MERTTVYLTPSLKRRLGAAAARQHIPEAHVIRDALERHLGDEKAQLPDPVGRCRDGGVADRADDALSALGFGRR